MHSRHLLPGECESSGSPKGAKSSESGR